MRLAAFLLLAFAVHAFAQGSHASPAGLWQTLDDETHAPKALLRIADHAGVLSGRIVKLFPAPGEDADPRCTKCPDERHGQRVIGMKILWNLHRDGNGWSGGEILDPESGDVYRASLHLDENGRTLAVRGYIGIPMLGRSQTWTRVDP